MGRSLYSYWINRDRKIPNVKVRTSTIPEELGRISYLLSDKTGTLTKNDMELKRLHMGTLSYGSESKDEISSHLELVLMQIKQQAALKESVEPHRHRKSIAFPIRGRRDISSRVYDIVQALALCHNVTPIIEANGTISYQASSPDEVAIVKWTESVGMTLYLRDTELIRLRTPQGEFLNFEVLYIFPFTSETKRMGIIVRDQQTGEVVFYEKGADSVMSLIVQRNDWFYFLSNSF